MATPYAQQLLDTGSFNPNSDSNSGDDLLRSFQRSAPIPRGSSLSANSSQPSGPSGSSSSSSGLSPNSLFGLGKLGFDLGARGLDYLGALGEGALGSAGAIAGGAASIWNIIQDAMSKNTPDTVKGVNAGIDAAAGIAAPFTFGLSALGAPIAKAGFGNFYKDIGALPGGTPNWSSAIGDIGPFSGPTKAIASMFGMDTNSKFGKILGALDPITGPFSMLFGAGKPSVYMPKRQAAGKEATSELQNLGGAFQQAGEHFAKSGDSSAFLTALQTQFGDRNPVRSYLTLPSELASQVTGQPGAPGTQVSLSWSQLDPTSFSRLIDVFQSNPDLINTAVQGSGDVAYLPQAQAEQVAAGAAQQARGVLQFLIGHGGAAGRQQQGEANQLRAWLANNPGFGTI